MQTTIILIVIYILKFCNNINIIYKMSNNSEEKNNDIQEEPMTEEER